MRKIKILTLTLMMIVMCSVSSFAVTTLELSDRLSDIENEVTENIESSKGTLLDKAYPVGSVYATTEDLSASDMHDKFGGTWVQIKDSFLWAKDADVAGADPVPDTATLGKKGGQRYYNLSAVLGPDEDDELTYTWSFPSQYMSGSPNYAFKGIGFTEDDETVMEKEGSFSGSIPVTEESSSDRTTEIMPPYTVVKMFKRTK